MGDYMLLIIIGCCCCSLCLCLLLFIFYKKQKKQKQKNTNGDLQRIKSDLPITPIMTVNETEMEPMHDQISLNMATNTNNSTKREQSASLPSTDDDETEGDDMYLVGNTNVTPQNVGDDNIPRLPTENLNDDNLLNEDENDDDNVIVDIATPQSPNNEGDKQTNDDENDENDAMYA